MTHSPPRGDKPVPTTRPLPDGFEAVRSLTIGSNLLEDVQVAMAIGDVPLLLVAVDVVPKIWLSAPVGPESQDRRYVVEANMSCTPAVIVSLDGKSKTTTVDFNGKSVLTARALSRHNVCIDQLDLRPFGLNIVADGDSMTVGGVRIRSKHVRGATVGIALGGVEPEGTTRI